MVYRERYVCTYTKDGETLEHEEFDDFKEDGEKEVIESELYYFVGPGYTRGPPRDPTCNLEKATKGERRHVAGNQTMGSNPVWRKETDTRKMTKVFHGHERTGETTLRRIRKVKINLFTFKDVPANRAQVTWRAHEIVASKNFNKNYTHLAEAMKRIKYSSQAQPDKHRAAAVGVESKFVKIIPIDETFYIPLDDEEAVQYMETELGRRIYPQQ